MENGINLVSELREDSIMGDRGGQRYGNHRRFASRGNEEHQCDPQDVEEITRLQQRVRDLEMQHEEHS